MTPLRFLLATFLLLVFTTSCSRAFLRERGYRCTTSLVAPSVDAGIATVGLAGTVVGIVDLANCDPETCTSTAGLGPGISLLLAVLFASSAIYGFSYNRDCRCGTW